MCTRRNKSTLSFSIKLLYITTYLDDVFFEIVIKWRRLMFCSFLNSVCRTSMFQWSVKENAKPQATSLWNFVCICCMVVKVFWTLNRQRKSKETLPRWQNWQESHSYYSPSAIQMAPGFCPIAQKLDNWYSSDFVNFLVTPWPNVKNFFNKI